MTLILGNRVQIRNEKGQPEGTIYKLVGHTKRDSDPAFILHDESKSHDEVVDIIAVEADLVEVTGA